jgi:selenocysteine-specific elongation factor
VASAEALGRVRLLGNGSLAPGERALAQLRLETRVAAGRGDRLVIRSYSPAATIGGAVVVDPLPPRRRVRDRATVARLRDAPTLAAAAEAVVEEAGPSGIETPRLAARLTVTHEELAAALATGPALVRLGAEPAHVIARSGLDALAAAALAALAAFHRDQPLRPAMPREELRTRVLGPTPAAVFDHLVRDLAEGRRLRALPDGVALAGHAVLLSTGEQDARLLLLEAAAAAGLAGLAPLTLAKARGADPALVERVARVLLGEKVLVRIGDGLLVARDALEGLKLRVRERWPAGSKLEVGPFKELVGLTRKHAIPLLEYLDRERVTRRVGADRVVI